MTSYRNTSIVAIFALTTLAIAGCGSTQSPQSPGNALHEALPSVGKPTDEQALEYLDDMCGLLEVAADEELGLIETTDQVYQVLAKSGISNSEALAATVDVTYLAFDYSCPELDWRTK